MLYFKFQGQSDAQTPQPFFDTDFEGLASNADLYIFNQDDSQEYAWAYFGYVSVYTVYSICYVKSLAQIIVNYYI